MPLFTRIKKAKQAADAHKSQRADHSAPSSTPYRHVPTHAEQDALSACPMRWTSAEAKAKIEAHHKRKSTAMSRSSSEISLPTRPFMPGDLSIDSIMQRPRPSSVQSAPYGYAGPSSRPESRVYFSHASSSRAVSLHGASTPTTKRSPLATNSLTRISMAEEDEGEKPSNSEAFATTPASTASSSSSSSRKPCHPPNPHGSVQHTKANQTPVTGAEDLELKPPAPHPSPATPPAPTTLEIAHAGGGAANFTLFPHKLGATEGKEEGMTSVVETGSKPDSTVPPKKTKGRRWFGSGGAMAVAAH